IFSWPTAPEAPGWAILINNILKPGIAYEEEEDVNMPKRSAIFYNTVGNYRLAVKELQPNIYRYENDAEAYVTLANSYMQYGAFMSSGDDIVRRLDSAAYYLQVAKTIDPQEKNIYSASGNLQLMKGNYVRAKADLETYVKLDRKSTRLNSSHVKISYAVFCL